MQTLKRGVNITLVWMVSGCVSKFGFFEPMVNDAYFVLQNAKTSLRNLRVRFCSDWYKKSKTVVYFFFWLTTKFVQVSNVLHIFGKEVHFIPSVNKNLSLWENEIGGMEMFVNEAVMVKTTISVSTMSSFFEQNYWESLCNWTVKQYFRRFEKQCILNFFSEKKVNSFINRLFWVKHSK